MSRQVVSFADGRQMVIGWDGPFNTWFAQMHAAGDSQNNPPVAVVGWAPDEVALLLSERPDAVVGPYPVEDVEEMLTKMIPEFIGVEPDVKQADCWGCGKPPWQDNPECSRHPYNRLRGT